MLGRRATHTVHTYTHACTHAAQVLCSGKFLYFQGRQKWTLELQYSSDRPRCGHILIGAGTQSNSDADTVTGAGTDTQSDADADCYVDTGVTEQTDEKSRS